MRKSLVGVAATLLLILAACSETPQTAEKKAEPEKPLPPVTGQSGLYKMFQVARNWAPDAQILTANSLLLSEVPDVPRGKAAAWQATFVSPAKSQSKMYTYSTVESSGNLHKGAFAGPEDAWTERPGGPASFPIAAVKIDTDAAYETALKNGGAEYDKKNPGQPVTFVLEKVAKHPNPVWRVMWGESASTSGFSVLVDASTGDFREKLH